MDDELTNLLPPDRLKLLRRGYTLRLSVVVIIFVTLLIVASGVLLLPTYVFLSTSAATKKEHLATLEATAPSVSETDISKRLESLTASTKILTTLDRIPSVSQLVAQVLSVARAGVTLTGFTYTPAAANAKTTLPSFTISGLAATRDALRTYQIALQDLSIVETATLPVSAYAQSSDITFTISLALKP